MKKSLYIFSTFAFISLAVVLSFLCFIQTADARGKTVCWIIDEPGYVEDNGCFHVSLNKSSYFTGERIGAYASNIFSIGCNNFNSYTNAIVSFTSPPGITYTLIDRSVGGLGDHVLAGSKAHPASSYAPGQYFASFSMLYYHGQTRVANINIPFFIGSPPPTVDIKANNSDGPITISYNTAATLSWTSTNASSCSASGAWSGSKPINGSQSTGNLTSSKTYTITCTGSGGTASDSVTVNVGEPPCSPINGGWTNWNWGSWDNIGGCGDYQADKQKQQRDATRTCTNPSPSCGGADCSGPDDTSETQYIDCVEPTVTISGRVTDNNGDPINGVDIHLCQAGTAVTGSNGSNGEYSVTADLSDPYCSRINGGLEPGHTSIRAVNNNDCIPDYFATYEWQIAGQNVFRSCDHEAFELWDRDSDSNVDFVVTYPPSINGACGTADGHNFAYTDTNYSSYTQCSTPGNPSNTDFPDAGSSANWTCPGSNGGNPSGTCTANRSGPPLTLSVSLSANPSSGSAPLDVNLTATVSGTQTGTINYTFYCNRSDSGTNITDEWRSGECGLSKCGAKFDGINTNPKTVADVCRYSSEGTYTAKVIVERGDSAVEHRQTITVTTPGCSCTWSNDGCGVNPCATNEMKMTKACNPAGCDTGTQCILSLVCQHKECDVNDKCVLFPGSGENLCNTDGECQFPLPGWEEVPPW